MSDVVCCVPQGYASGLSEPTKTKVGLLELDFSSLSSELQLEMILIYHLRLILGKSLKVSFYRLRNTAKPIISVLMLKD